ncbi:ATP-binding protein [Lelliottia nimipressuralis]
MKNISAAGGALERLKKIIPVGVTPKFTSAAELMAWQQAEGRKHAAEVDKQNQQTRTEKIFGRSGIQELHCSCTFASYCVEGAGQKHALTMAKSYAQNFGTGFSSFVFSGNPGTGKNHLAAAIGNFLLKQGRSVLVVTIPDLTMRLRACYDGNGSESAVINDLCNVDLLVLDDVGVQRESRSEWVVLNQIVDRRLAAMKPVGMLTNLNHAELERVLGPRVMDRLTMDGGMWVNFDWGSFRKNVRHLGS